MAPIMPHITEELYQARFAKDDANKSLHVSDWPKFDKKLIDEKVEAIGDLVVDIIAAVRKHKSENSLSMKEKLDRLVIQTKKSYEEVGSGLEVAFNDLKETLSIKEIVFGKADQDLGKIKISIS
jgi:valyl-tRNA synthetase